MYFLDDLHSAFFQNESFEPLRERQGSETSIAKQNNIVSTLHGDERSRVHDFSRVAAVMGQP